MLFYMMYSLINGNVIEFNIYFSNLGLASLGLLPNILNNSYLGIPIRSYVGQSESYYFNCNNAKVDGINEIGGNVELILVPSPNDTHGSVINIYGDSSVINWMLKQ